jgi:hypothetical protein
LFLFFSASRFKLHSSFSKQFDADSYNVGESGYGAGIRTLFRTGSVKKIELMADQQIVASSYVGEYCKSIFQPDRSRGLWTFNDCTPRDSIRTGNFSHVILDYQNGLLSLSFDDLDVAANLPVTLQVSPARDWMVVFGARTEQAGDTHTIQNVAIAAGASVASQPVPIDISLNGQQFHRLDFDLVYFSS